MSGNPIDEKAIDQTIADLQTQYDSLRDQLDQIRLIQNNLSKIKMQVLRIDTIKGVNTPVLASPIDNDMGGAPMDDAKRQAIHDSNMAAAKKILGK